MRSGDTYLSARLDRLAATLERMRLDEYMEYVTDRKRVIFSHLLFGMLRGMGFAIGFSILSAVVVVLMRHLVVENIPLIGGFLAEVINAIQDRL